MSLRVLVDGLALPDDEARAFWGRFSAYLEDHRGDLAGFAQAEGYASVHPETHGGMPVLVVSRAVAQRPYANAPHRPAGGSPAPQDQGKGGPRAANPRGKRRRG